MLEVLVNVISKEKERNGMWSVKEKTKLALFILDSVYILNIREPTKKKKKNIQSNKRVLTKMLHSKSEYKNTSSDTTTTKNQKTQ